MGAVETACPKPEFAGQLIVCERTGRWAAALRSAWSPPRGWLRETRSSAECLEALDAAPASLVLVELLAGDAADGLELLAAIDRRHPLARSAVVAQRGLERLEPLARELGAIHFTVVPRDVRPLVRLVERALEGTPPPELPLVERLLAELATSKSSPA
jgi:DNA-binding NtrC family response regulator